MKRTAENDALRSVGAGVILFLIFILQYSGLTPLTLFGMTAMLVVPAVVFCSMFMTEFSGAMFGLVFGVCLDAVSARAVCFNALFLLAVGCLSALFSKHLFHRNLYSALMMSAVTSVLYFVIKWVVFTAFTTDGAWTLLCSHSLPSAVYTAVVSVPLYFLFSAVFKAGSGEVKRV